MPKTKKPEGKTRPWQVGDRVALTYSTKHAIWPRTHGVIVYYHVWEHDPKEPRVRWADGWGTSVDAKFLRKLTPAERKRWPRRPKLFPCDGNVPRSPTS